jgi:hypothetical protein
VVETATVEATVDVSKIRNWMRWNTLGREADFGIMQVADELEKLGLGLSGLAAEVAALRERKL